MLNNNHAKVQSQGPGYAATSGTSLTITTGSITFTTQTGLAYTPGARVRISYVTVPGDYMEGVCAAYNSSTGVMTVTVDTSAGAGTFTSWNVNLAGNPGTASFTPWTSNCNANTFSLTNCTSITGAGSGLGLGTSSLCGIGVTINGGNTDHMLNVRGDPASFALGSRVGPILESVKSDQSSIVPLTIFASQVYFENGPVTVQKNLYLTSGSISVSNGANHNVALSTNVNVRLGGATGSFSITGFAGGVDGQELRLYNLSGQQMTLANNNAGSSAGNRILTNTGADVVLRSGNSAATLYYDGGVSAWILMSTN